MSSACLCAILTDSSNPVTNPPSMCLFLYIKLFAEMFLRDGNLQKLHDADQELPGQYLY